MATLADAYDSWRQAPFPPGSENDLLDELHADLSLVDTWVAESVIPFVERRQHQPATVDVLGAIRDIRERTDNVPRPGSDEDRQLASQYHEYAELLDTVYRAFLEARP